MNLKEVLKKAGDLGYFPFVEIDREIKHFPNQRGQIKQINDNGFSVDFGGEWNKWFRFSKNNDNRSTYTSELIFSMDQKL